MKTIKLLTLILASSIGTVLTAQKNSNPTYPIDEIPSYEENGIKWGALNKTPLVFAGIKDLVTGNSPEEKAINWLRLNKEKLKLSDINHLVAYSTRSGRAGHTVRFRQMYDGVEVYKSEVVIHMNNNSEVTYVSNTYDPSVEDVLTVPQLTEESAFLIAKDHIKVEGNISFSSNKLNVFNRGTKGLVYVVIIEGEKPTGSWEVIVDAQNGNVIRAADKACNHHDHGMIKEVQQLPMPMPPANGTGTVFDPDPLSTALVSYGGNYVDGNDATNASLDATLSTVTLLDLNFTGTQYQLVGPYAEITDFENPFRGLFAQASSSFNFNRFDNGFEAINCYYHIDKSMRHINEYLNIPLMPFQYNGGVQFDPHGLNGQDNSHYLGGSGRVSFGEGGVDDAEDADVVLHELGHGIHDWLTSGNLSQVNGLSEGSGDYWASSYSRSLNQWTTANPQYYWMFSWDGHNPFWSGRITNYTALYPGGLTGAIHTDGQIWASALLRIWEIIGRDKVDAAFLEGLAMTGSNTNQQDAAIAVRQAAIDMGYSCADVSVFTTEFTATGYVLPALAAPSSTINSTLCYNESIVVNGTTYNSSNPSGTEVFLGSTSACDSTVTISLTFYPQQASTINQTICNGESIVVNGTTYDANNPSGTEIIPNIGPNGCDSVITVVLTVLNPSVHDITTTLCTGSSIVVNGTTYDANNPSGTEVFINGAANGCDSTVTINLSFAPSLSSTVSGPICAGESIVVNGTTYDANNPSGVEVFTNVGASGCDSTVTISLTPVAPITGNENSTICNNESVIVNGTTYNAANPSGIEVISGGGMYGCDSTVNINLNVLPQLTGSETGTYCAAESIVVNGTTYNAANPFGTEVFTNIGAAGCDSTVTINLTFEAPIDVTVTDNSPTLTANASGATYQWVDCNNGNSPIAGATSQSFTATANGSYAVQVTVGNCTETSVCQMVANIGLNELSQFGLSVYPNPSSGEFILTHNWDVINYTVVAVDGRLVHQTKQSSSKSIAIDLSKESKGVYFLRLEMDDQQQTIRLVIE